MDDHDSNVNLPPPPPVPTMPSGPPTSPSGLPVNTDGELRDLILAFRADWQEWKGLNEERMNSFAGGMKILDARQVVFESDFRQIKGDVAAARAIAEAARERADSAFSMAETASVAARSLSHDGAAAEASLISALTDTRGMLTQATEAIRELKSTDATLIKNDEDLKALVAEQAKNTTAAVVREMIGKNPKLVAAIAGLLMVLANVLSQRFLVPPAAPNQGALPAPTPTVHVTEGER